jgi:hypothetical protein
MLSSGVQGCGQPMYDRQVITQTAAHVMSLGPSAASQQGAEAGSLLPCGTMRTLQIRATSPQRIQSRSSKAVIAVVVAMDTVLPNVWACAEVQIDTHAVK